MENFKNVAPIEDFNWDAYENGETVTNVSHEDLEKAYDNTLNKVVHWAKDAQEFNEIVLGILKDHNVKKKIGRASCRERV